MSNPLIARIHALEMENAELRTALAQAEQRSATELRQVRDTLSQRERDLQSILDNMPYMISSWDRNQRNRFGNHTHFDWFGIEPDEMPGKHMREVLGEDRYRLSLPYVEAALQGEPQLFERAIPAPDGRGIRYSLVHYIPDMVDGDVRGMYALVDDITAERVAQAALRESEARLRASEERYRGVVEDQTECIARLRGDGTFLFANKAFCSFFGMSQEKLQGLTWVPVCFPEDRPYVESQLRALSLQNPVVSIETRVLDADGQVHWMQFVNRGFFDAEGALAEFQCVGRDITDVKLAEASLRDVLNQLEKRVVERTEEVRRLAVQATLAEERERQAIARDLHDDLGQRLHVLRLKLDGLAKHRPETADEVSALRVLVAEASRIVRSLTSQLSPPVLRKLGIAAAMQWLVDEMARQYGLKVEFQCNDIQALLTPAQSSILFRSARELLINVVKHAGTDRARLNLSQTREALLVSVEDGGVGMPDPAGIPDAMHGFGLASMRERMTFLGGDMEIAKPATGGVRIMLTLPLGSDSVLRGLIDP
jgi:PAS domain S-box-containing protein